jgi:hypothetical protein
MQVAGAGDRLFVRRKNLPASHSHSSWSTGPSRLANRDRATVGPTVVTDGPTALPTPSAIATIERRAWPWWHGHGLPRPDPGTTVCRYQRCCRTSPPYSVPTASCAKSPPRPTCSIPISGLPDSGEARVSPGLRALRGRRVAGIRLS